MSCLPFSSSSGLLLWMFVPADVSRGWNVQDLVALSLLHCHIMTYFVHRYSSIMNLWEKQPSDQMIFLYRGQSIWKEGLMCAGHSSDVLLHVVWQSEAGNHWRECSWSFWLDSLLSGSVQLMIMFAVKTNLPTLQEKERGWKDLWSDGKCLWGTSSMSFFVDTPIKV